jgi:hypothetical protein
MSGLQEAILFRLKPGLEVTIADERITAEPTLAWVVAALRKELKQ